MALREKTLAYMKLTMPPFEGAVEQMMKDFREQFAAGYKDGLPPEVVEALAKTEASLRDHLPTFQSDVAGVYEMHLTEADLDVLVAHQLTEAERKIGEARERIMMSFVEAQQKWMRESMTAVEAELARLLAVEVQPAPPPAEPKVVVASETA